MARRELTLTHYQAEMVLFPDSPGRIREALKITVFGPNFPERAVLPEILVGRDLARNVSIARDQKSIRGIFTELPADGSHILVRYGDSQEGIVPEPFLRHQVRPLPKEC